MFISIITMDISSHYVIDSICYCECFNKELNNQTGQQIAEVPIKGI